MPADLDRTHNQNLYIKLWSKGLLLIYKGHKIAKKLNEINVNKGELVKEIIYNT